MPTITLEDPLQAFWNEWKVQQARFRYWCTWAELYLGYTPTDKDWWLSRITDDKPKYDSRLFGNEDQLWSRFIAPALGIKVEPIQMKININW